MYQAHAAAHPAHRSGKLDGVAAQLIGGRHQTRRLLGSRYNLFQFCEGSWQPRCQAIRQQAEGGVRFPAIPARYLRAHQRPARIGAVARQRASAARVIRAPVEPCLAPPFGANVLLAGVQGLEPKLHRSWPGGGCAARHTRRYRRFTDTLTGIAARLAVNRGSAHPSFQGLSPLPLRQLAWRTLILIVAPQRILHQGARAHDCQCGLAR